jgi:hypothetical protein
VRLRSVVEGDAEYAKDEARRASRGRRADLDEELRWSAEADVLSRILAIMDEMSPEDAL